MNQSKMSESELKSKLKDSQIDFAKMKLLNEEKEKMQREI